MNPEFAGIERRLDELYERLGRLRPLQQRTRDEFANDAYLRDIAERNLEVLAQCSIDIANRIISLEGARKPRDYYEAFIILGEVGAVPSDFAKALAPISGFRNVLIHNYVGINWDQVYDNLQQLDDIDRFADYVRRWLSDQVG